jgi:2-iminobutanoate/2-iminopropanoate deaminase
MRRVVVPDVGRLPAFSHASVADRQVFVSGVLGTLDETLDLAPGGTGPQTAQTMRNIGTVLAACGCTFDDVAKLNVYLSDMSTFEAMNEAYAEFVGAEPPARITVGVAGLALGAAVEIDCVAFVPEPGTPDPPLA